MKYQIVVTRTWRERLQTKTFHRVDQIGGDEEGNVTFVLSSGVPVTLKAGEWDDIHVYRKMEQS